MGTVGEAASNGGPKRRGCFCTKEDFLPEESFQNW